MNEKTEDIKKLIELIERKNIHEFVFSYVEPNETGENITIFTSSTSRLKLLGLSVHTANKITENI